MNFEYIEKCAKEYDGKLNDQEKKRLNFFLGLWKTMDDAINARDPKEKYQMPKLGEVRELYMAGIPIFDKFPANINADQFAQTANAIANYILENEEYPEDVKTAVRAVDWIDLLIKQSNQNVKLDIDDLGTRIASLVLILASFTFYESISDEIMNAIGGDRMTNSHPLLCPVCGSSPSISIIDRNQTFNNTGRELYCSRCGASWEFDRVRCPRCGTDDESMLQFCNIGDAKNHQLQFCAQCGELIRTTFVDVNLPEVSPVVEDVVSTPLEELARSGMLQRIVDAQNAEAEKDSQEN